MKTLSIKQPYAELVVSGKKTIELRSWNTDFRGEFLVHASKIASEGTMKKFGFTDLPIGTIVGKVNLVDVKEYKDEEEFDGDKDKHLADTSFSEFGFVLEGAQRVEPIKAKGQLGFWDFEGVVK